MRFLSEPSHLLLVALVVIVLFGSRRLPDAARGLGRSLRIFKAEMKQMKDDDVPRPDRPAGPEAAATPLEGRVLPTDPQRDRGEVRRDA